jgi:Tetracyclin repressor-like, C-terminal domain
MRGMMRFYTSPAGAIYAQLIGESQFYPPERERIRTCQVNIRRAAVTKIWDRGVARGELDPNVDPRWRWISSSGRRCTGGRPGTVD